MAAAELREQVTLQWAVMRQQVVNQRREAMQQRAARPQGVAVEERAGPAPPQETIQPPPPETKSLPSFWPDPLQSKRNGGNRDRSRSTGSIGRSQ